MFSRWWWLGILLPALASAQAMPEAVKREGLAQADWKKVSSGEVVSHVVRSSDRESFAAGAVIMAVPWKHAFDQIGRVEEQGEYSSCLKALQVLMKTTRDGRTYVKTREAHKSLWLTARFTLDYQEDPERREIRWQLDPGAANDVTRMTGAWRFIPLDEGRTLVTYRTVGSSGAAIPQEIQDYFASMMLPGFLKAVRKHVEDAHARGHHG